MLKRLILMILASTLIFGGIFGFIHYKNQKMAKAMAGFKFPPVSVEAVAVSPQSWQSSIHTTGSIVSNRGVYVSNSVEGIITDVGFESGQQVSAGDILVRLDDAVEQASLSSFTARLELARVNYERDKKLLEKKAISKTDFDRTEAELKVSEAQVTQTRALIEQKLVKAPFAGKLGIKKHARGQFLEQGSEIVSLQDTSLLYVDFSLPERYFPLTQKGQKVRLNIDTTDHVFQGQITALEPEVDLDTRTFGVRAGIMQNSKHVVPGAYVDVEVMLGEPRQVIAIDQTAINFSLYGNTVYRVAEDDEGALIAEQVYVELGERKGNLVVIKEGIAEGDQLVVAGQIKLNHKSAIKLVPPVDSPSDTDSSSVSKVE